jgi:hypothetical protein
MGEKMSTYSVLVGIFTWLTLEAGGGLLKRIVGFHKMLGISRVALQLQRLKKYSAVWNLLLNSDGCVHTAAAAGDNDDRRK